MKMETAAVTEVPAEEKISENAKTAMLSLTNPRLKLGVEGPAVGGDRAREGADCAHRDDGGVAARLAWQARQFRRS
jgi:hypothetical protein